MEGPLAPYRFLECDSVGGNKDMIAAEDSVVRPKYQFATIPCIHNTSVSCILLPFS